MRRNRTERPGAVELLGGEVAWVLTMVILAGLRLSLSAAALPFFGNMDEDAHFDLVYKYAHGYWPQPGNDRFSAGAVDLIALYRSMEFLCPPDRYVPSPVWSFAPELRAAYLAQVRERAEVNYEAFSPPVYYLVAGGWFDLGEFLGLKGGYLLYWVRFLDVVIYAAVIGTAYWFCRRYYPGTPALALGVTLLLAFLPQDVFDCINSDVLSPLAFLVGLALLLDWYQRDHTPYRLAGAAGLATAAAFLVKYTNLPLVVLLGFFLVRKVWRLYQDKSLRREMPRIVLLVAATGVPVGAWLAHNRLVLGDLFGTAAKMRYWGWSYKPLGDLGDHPLFSFAGLNFFWQECTRTFWRGELVWRNQPLASAAADQFFVWSSALCLGAAAVGWLVRRKTAPAGERRIDALAFVAVGLSVLLLAMFSVLFDFGDGCPYPSRRNPFMTSGRLIAGMLVPYFILYVRGLQFLCARWAKPAGFWIALGAVVVMMTVSRAELLWQAAQSSYNWFHLP
jgi:Predicted membrane protein (DUF2142)